MNEITAYMNAMPPAAAMAGIYTEVDTNRGVWKAPANVLNNFLVGLKVKIEQQEQKKLDVSGTGELINAICPRAP